MALSVLCPRVYYHSTIVTAMGFTIEALLALPTFRETDRVYPCGQ